MACRFQLLDWEFGTCSSRCRIELLASTLLGPSLQISKSAPEMLLCYKQISGTTLKASTLGLTLGPGLFRQFVRLPMTSVSGKAFVILKYRCMSQRMHVKTCCLAQAGQPETSLWPRATNDGHIRKPNWQIATRSELVQRTTGVAVSLVVMLLLVVEDASHPQNSSGEEC